MRQPTKGQQTTAGDAAIGIHRRQLDKGHTDNLISLRQQKTKKAVK
jgi:hypothetical protein